MNPSVWDDIKALLSTKPYPDEVAAWQFLSTFIFTMKSNQVVILEVYQTGNSIGCYHLNNQKGYYIVPDEKDFFVHIREFVMLNK